MKFSKQKFINVVKFLFPEFQLIDLVKQEGFIAKKQPKPITSNNTAQTYTANTYSTTYQSNIFYSTTSTNAWNDQSAATSTQTFRTNPNVQNKGPSSKQLDDIFEEIKRKINNQIIGQQSFVLDLVAAYKQGFMNDQMNGIKNVILLAGAAGTGKKTTLELLLSELYLYGLIPSSTADKIDLGRYEADEANGNFIQDIENAFQARCGTIFFKLNKAIDPAITSIVAELAEKGTYRNKEGYTIDVSEHFIVFYIDYPIMDFNADGQIPASLSNEIPVPILRSIKSLAISYPLQRKELLEVASALLKKSMDRLAETADISITVKNSVINALVDMALSNRKFGETVQQWINNELIPAVMNLRARNKINRKEKIVIQYENQSFRIVSKRIDEPVKTPSFVREETTEEVLQELNELVGLQEVKTFIKELLETAKFNRMKANEGAKAVSMALHMVFTGNPGTGKTTVARLIARILKSMGFLSQGQLIEVARQDLVGQYVGSTAPKTMAKINEAIGGVLFIDEAYTLARNEHDPFGLEAIDTIVKAMEDHRGELVIVLAGYTKEMETFLQSNPGLRSRFPFIVEFPDYTPADMLIILQRMVQGNGYRLEEGAEEGLLELFEQRQIPGRNDSGNGRLIRNLFEEAVRKQASRISSLAQYEKADLELLTKEDFSVSARKVFNIADEFDKIVGLETVKSFVSTLEKQLIVERRRKDAGIKVDSTQMLNMIFSGNPGTGKTTMARLLANMMKEMGVLKKGQLIEVDRSDLVAEYVGQTAIKTTKVVESALGGILFIDEAYALAQDGVQGGGYGKEAIDTLVRLIELHKDNLVVILAGYTEDMKQFLRVNPGLPSRFPLQIEFPDYTAEEMAKIAAIMVQSRGFALADGVQPLLRRYFEEKQIPGKKDGGNGRLVRNTLEHAIRQQGSRLALDANATLKQLNELTAADFGFMDTANSSEQTESALGKLDAIIGLTEVKSFVRSLSAQIEMTKRRKELGLPQAAAQSLHMIFKGNPGTGKTTIARILASRLQELGVIKSDNVVETDRSGLVAGYVGQTALKTKEVIEQAIGGILFIDEAYSLAEGDQYGQEAIDTLVKAMDDYRDRLIVILAGYDQDMERFLDSNAGLRSRFPNIILFPDYSVDELLQIAKLTLGSQGYRMDSSAEKRLNDILHRYAGDITAGNGRLVRNIIEKAIRQHALRLNHIQHATIEDLSTLVAVDFER